MRKRCQLKCHCNNLMKTLIKLVGYSVTKKKLVISRKIESILTGCSVLIPLF